MTNRWRLFAIGMLAVAVVEFVLLVRGAGTALLQSTSSRREVQDAGFEAFEAVNFAREFSERLQTFESRAFKSSQIATASLLDDDARVARLAEIDRLTEKIERRDVNQKARLTMLLKLPSTAPGAGERFRADLDVELTEGIRPSVTSSRFTTRLEFSISRTARSEQNPWGFQAHHLVPSVVQRASQDAAATSVSSFALRPGVATLLQFPCSIENVELPKATSIRVKLTTLDISELQLKTDVSLAAPQIVRAICRDRVFTMKFEAEAQVATSSAAITTSSAAVTTSSMTIGEPLVVFQSLTLENSTVVNVLAKKKKYRKTDVEKSIEDQLGFVVEEE